MTWQQEVLLTVFWTFFPIWFSAVIVLAWSAVKRWLAWRRIWRSAREEAADAEYEAVEADDPTAIYR